MGNRGNTRNTNSTALLLGALTLTLALGMNPTKVRAAEKAPSSGTYAEELAKYNEIAAQAKKATADAVTANSSASKLVSAAALLKGKADSSSKSSVAASTAVDTALKANDVAQNAYKAARAKVGTAANDAEKASDANNSAAAALASAKKEQSAYTGKDKTRIADLAKKVADAQKIATAATATSKTAASALATAQKGADTAKVAGSKAEAAVIVAQKKAEDAGKAAEVAKAAYSDAAKAAESATSESAAATARAKERTTAATAQLAVANALKSSAGSGTSASSSTLSFSDEFKELIPPVIPYKGENGQFRILLSDRKFQGMECRIGFVKEFINGGGEWFKAEQQENKKWLIRLRHSYNTKNRIECFASDGSNKFATGQREYVTQSNMDGQTPEKEGCGFAVSGKSKAFYFAAAAKALKSSGKFAMSEPNFSWENERKESSAQILTQPYSITFANGSGMMSVSRTKRFDAYSVKGSDDLAKNGADYLMMSRAWKNSQTGCFLRGTYKDKGRGQGLKNAFHWITYLPKSGEIWDPNVKSKTPLYALNKSPVTGGNITYNAGIVSPFVVVFNTKGQGVALDVNGKVIKTFAGIANYVRQSTTNYRSSIWQNQLEDLYFW